MGLVIFILQKQQQMMTLNEQGLIDDELISDIFGQIIKRVIAEGNERESINADVEKHKKKSDFRGYDKTSYKGKLGD